MNTLSIKLKLGISFGVLLIIMATMAVVSDIAIGQLSKLTDEEIKQVEKVQYSIVMNNDIEVQTSTTRGYVIAGREETLKRREEGAAEFSRMSAKMDALLQTARGKALFAHIQELAADLRGTQDRALELRRAGKATEAGEVLFTVHANEVRSDLQKSIGDLIAICNKLRNDAKDVHEATEARTVRMLLALAGVGLLVGIVVAVGMSRAIGSSTTRMLSMIEQIASNNLAIPDMDVKSQDEIGKACLAMNRMKNNLQHTIQSIARTAQHLATAGSELSASSQQISANSEETSAQAGTVSSAAQQVNENLQSVATGAEEMTATIQSIAGNAQEAAKVASNAVKTAEQTNQTVSKLGESSAEIGQVIKVITSIAQQTNLLALNAAIEAARAGEAGKGFAVVANEVKELAKQTAKATEDISQKITTIQGDTKEAVTAIGNITGVISQINDISSTIATAVEEQSATTNEMSRNVSEAAKGSGDITQNIHGVAEAANSTSSSAQLSQKSSEELAGLAAELNRLVEQFKLGEGGNHRPSALDGVPIRARAAAAN